MLKRTKIIIFGSLFALIGSVGGVFAYKMLNTGGTGGDVADVNDPKLTSRYDANDNNIQVPDTLSQSDEDFKKILYITNGEFHRSSYYTASASGVVKASVMGIPYDQSVSSRRTKNNEDIFFETTSLSFFVKTSEQRYTNPNSWLVRKGQNPTERGADYSSSQVSALTKDAYYERYGQVSQDICNYVINDYTYVSAKYNGETDGIYSFTYVLDSSVSCEKYKREVQYMSGASGYPTFSTSELTINIDKDFQVKSMTSHDVYDISMPGIGSLTCSSSITENYTYSTSEINVSEKSSFEPFFGTTNNVVDNDKTAITYLGEAFSPLLSTKDPINAEINATINEKPINIYASIDLANKVYNISLNDQIDLKYVGNNVYVMTDDNCFLVSSDELGALIKKYNVSTSVEGLDLSSLLTNPIVAEVIANIELTKTETAVQVSLPLDIGQVNINMNRDSDDKVTLKNIDGQVSYQGLNASFAVNLAASQHTYKKIPTEVNEFKNLTSLADKVESIVNSKGIEGDISLSTSIASQEIGISGHYAADLSSSAIKYNFALAISYNSKEYNLILNGTKEELYVFFGDSFVVKTTYKELSALISSILVDNGVSANEDLLTNVISNLDITVIVDTIESILNKVKTGDTSITVGLDLINYNLGNIDIVLDYSSNLSLGIGNYGSITVLPLESTIETVSPSSYVSIDALNKIYSSVKNLMSGKYDVTLDSFNYGDLLLNGKVTVDATDTSNVSLEGTLAVKYHEFNVNISFSYINHVAYLKLNDNVKIKMSDEEIKGLISRFTNTEGTNSLDLDSLLKDLPVLDILNSLLIDNSGNVSVSVPLNFVNIDDVINITLSADSVISIKDKNNIGSAYISSSKKTLVAPKDDGKYITIDDVDKLINVVNEMKKYVEKGEYSFSVSTGVVYNEVLYPVTIDVRATYKDSIITFKADIYTTFQGNKLSGTIIYDGSYFYIDLLGVKVKLSYDAGLELLTTLGNKYGIDTSFLTSLTSSKKALNISSLSINDVISSLSMDNGKLELILNLSSFYTSLNEFKIAVSIDENNEISSVSTSSIILDSSAIVLGPTISINYGDSSFDYCSLINKNEYLDLSSVSSIDADFITSVEEMIKTDNFSAKINVEVAGVSIDLNVYFNVSTLSMSVNGTVSYEGITLDLDIKYLEKVLYVDVFSASHSVLKYQGSINDIKDLVSYISTSFNLGINADVNTKIEVSTLLTYIAKFNTYIKDISFTSTSASISLDLSEFNLGTYVVSYSTSKTIKVDSSKYGVITAQTEETNKVAEEVNGTYLTTEDVKVYIDEVKEILNSKNFSFALESLTYKGITLSNVSASVNIASGLSFGINGDINYETNDAAIKGTFYLVLKDNKLYVTVGGTNIIIEKDDVMSIIDSVNNSLNLGLDITSISALVNKVLALDFSSEKVEGTSFVLTDDIKSLINNVLSNISLTSSSLKVSLNVDALVKGIEIGDITVEYNLANNEVRVNSTSLITNAVVIYNSKSTVVVPTYEAYLSSSSLVSLAKSGLNIYEDIKNKDISYNFSLISPLTLTYKDKNIVIKSLTASIKYTEDSLYVLLNTVVNYDKNDIAIEGVLNNEVIYLNVNNAKVSIAQKDLMTVINTVLTKYKIDTTINLGKIELNLNEVLDSIVSKDNEISLVVNYQGYTFKPVLGITSSRLTSVSLNGMSVKEVTFTGVNVSVAKSAIEEKEITASDYLNLSSVSSIDADFITSVEEMIKIKKYELSSTTISLGDFTIIIGGVIDLTSYTIPTNLNSISTILNGLSLSLSGAVSYKNNEYPFDIKVSKDGTIYVYIGSITSLTAQVAFKGNISDIQGIYDYVCEKFGLTKQDIALPSIDTSTAGILAIVSKLNQILSVNSIKGTSLDINVNLNSFGFDYVINLIYNVDQTIGVKVTSNNEVIANAKLGSTKSSVAEITSLTNYLTAADVKSYIDEIIYIKSINKLSGTFNALLNMTIGNNINLANMTVAVEFEIDLSTSFNFYVKLSIDSDMFNGDVIITKVNKDIYIKLSEIVSHVSEDELKEIVLNAVGKFVADESKKLTVVSDITNAFDEIAKLDSGLATYLDGVKFASSSIDINSIISLINIKNIFDSLKLNASELAVSANLDALLKNKGIAIELGLINVKFDKANRLLDVNTDTYSAHVEYGADISTSRIKAIVSTTYVEKADLLSIISKINGVKSFITEKEYQISVSGDVITSGIKSWSYSGSVLVNLTTIVNKLKDNKPINFYDAAFELQNVTLNKYSADGNTIASSYVIDLIYQEDKIFISYNNSLRGYLTRVEGVTLGKYVYTLMNSGKDLTNDTVISILDMLGASGSIDTGIFDQITGGSSSGSSSFKINLNTLFKEVQDEQRKLSVTIDASQFYNQMYEGQVFSNPYVSAYMTTDSNDIVTEVGFKDMYTKTNESFDADLSFVRGDGAQSVAKISNNTIKGHTIGGTNLGDYYYIGNLNHLIETFVNSANLRQYEVNGTINMNVIGFIDFAFKINLKITLDDNNNPTIYCHFSVPWASAFVMYGGETDMYYQNGKIRFRNNYRNAIGLKKTAYLSYDTIDDMNNNVATMINFILQSVSIKDTVTNSVKNSKTNITLEKFIKKYSYNFNESTNVGTTSTTLDGAMLMESLADLSLSLTDEYKNVTRSVDGKKVPGNYLTKVSFTTGLTSAIDISGSFSLDNLGQAITINPGNAFTSSKW